MRLLKSVTPLFQRSCNAVWKIVGKNRTGHEYVEATSMPLPLYEVYRAGTRSLIEERLENPVEFRWREVVNDDFAATSSFLDYDFSA